MKTYLVLKFYDALQKGEEVHRKSFCRENGISERTFYRYVQDVAAFLKEQNSEITLCKKESSCVYRFEDKRALALQKTVAAEEGDANEIIVIEDDEAPSVIALKEEEEEKPARITLCQAPAL